MKNIKDGGMIFVAVALLVPAIARAQGTVYISDLGQSSTGSAAVGSDSWLATAFFTGANAGGYTLDSVQLAMTGSSGSPNGFSVMLYSAVTDLEAYPGSNLGALSGSFNPSSEGVFTYTPATDITLSPDTAYFLVLTAVTSTATGAYQWSTASETYNQNGGWVANYGVARLDDYQSSDGSSWTFGDFSPQYALAATPVTAPEPASMALIGVGALGFFWHRRKALAQ